MQISNQHRGLHLAHSDPTNLVDYFRNISDLARFIDASQDGEETYQLLTRGVCAHSQWDLSSIQVFDQDAGLAIPVVRHDPFNANDLSDFPGWDARYSPIGQVLTERKPLILKDAAAQDEFLGFRDDARQRGYHTTVIIPLDVRDSDRRPMVYSVASRAVVEVKETDLGFLQCVAELSAIAVRKMRKLDQERQQATRMRTILESLTASIDKTLDSEAAGSLASGLSNLFPVRWLAVDLTSGHGLFDPDAPPPFPLVTARRLPDDLISAALASKGLVRGAMRDLCIDGSNIRAEVSALQIAGSHVGALFFFGNIELSDQARTAAKAGRRALSAVLMRNFVEFQSRRITARRLMARLFAGDLHNRDELLDEAHRLDFDLSSPLRVVMIRAVDGSGFDDGAHSFILRSAQATFGPAISCILDDALILLIDDRREGGQRAQAAFGDRILPFLPPKTIFVMSNPVTKIEQLQRACETCRNTLDTAQSMRVSGWVTPVNVGEFPALMASADAGQIRAYLNGVLPEDLVASGRKAQVALETIEVFLQTGRRYQEAADQLQIHVSTLRYRLEQLSDRYDINFDDSDKCFEIELAIRLNRLRNSYEK